MMLWGLNKLISWKSTPNRWPHAHCSLQPNLTSSTPSLKGKSVLQDPDCCRLRRKMHLGWVSGSASSAQSQSHCPKHKSKEVTTLLPVVLRLNSNTLVSAYPLPVSGSCLGLVSLLLPLLSLGLEFHSQSAGGFSILPCWRDTVWNRSANGHRQ